MGCLVRCHPPHDEEWKKHTGLLPVRKWQRPLVLASGSPRRADLLVAAGIDATLFSPTLDDGVYTCGAMLHKKTLILPYAMSDVATAVSTLRIDDLLAALLESGP